jgi:hypothetical protein
MMDALGGMVLKAYDCFIGLLLLGDLAVDGCITKAPCGGGEKAGKSPVDRGKRGIKHSMVVDARGIPLGTITAPANRQDSPLLDDTPSPPWKYSEACSIGPACISMAPTTRTPPDSS